MLKLVVPYRQVDVPLFIQIYRLSNLEGLNLVALQVITGRCTHRTELLIPICGLLVTYGPNSSLAVEVFRGHDSGPLNTSHIGTSDPGVCRWIPEVFRHRSGAEWLPMLLES